MNNKKILILIILSFFVIGVCMGVADASHTFKKSGYKMKVTNKQYYKIKHKKDYGVSKKVGTKKKTVYKYKTVKTETFRSYYDSDGTYTGCNVFTYNGKYWKSSKYSWCGCKYKTVTHYKADGSYYEDEITYDKFRYKTIQKYNVYMWVGNLYSLVGDKHTIKDIQYVKPGKPVYWCF